MITERRYKQSSIDSFFKSSNSSKEDCKSESKYNNGIKMKQRNNINSMIDRPVRPLRTVAPSYDLFIFIF